ncbi:mandelate racemase/muconate lactonizing enzyme family protein, partial [Salmonella enterica]|nr:mandelate racemase/muconate lactonizing enzyme family protein [Salmonella enterica]
MKITSIEVFDCELKKRDQTMSSYNPVLIRVNTDSGLSGIGEVGLAYGAGAKAGVGIIRDLAPLIVGEDPLNIEKIWEFFFRKTFWGMGGGNVFYAGMSAIDIALWDIKGKYLGVPVYQLLGGKTNEKLRTYASQLQFGWGDKRQILVTP